MLEVATKRVLFDVKADIPAEFKEVLAGEEISAQVTIFNLGEVSGLNVTVIYRIIDMEGKILLERTNISDIQTQISSVESFALPETIQAGTYVFTAEILYEDSVTTSSDTFHVATEAEIEFPLRTDYAIYTAIAVVIFVFMIIMYLSYRRLKRVEKKHKKLYEKIEETEKRG